MSKLGETEITLQTFADIILGGQLFSYIKIRFCKQGLKYFYRHFVAVIDKKFCERAAFIKFARFPKIRKKREQS